VVLVKLDALTGERTLLGSDVDGVDENDISGKSLAVFDLDEISNNELLGVNGGGVAITDNDSSGLVLLSLQFLELLLLDVVVSGRDGSNNHDSEHNGGSVNPSMGKSLLPEANGE